MKHLFSIMGLIGIVALLVAPGLADDHRHFRRAQFVTIEFRHNSLLDIQLWLPPPCSGVTCFEEIPELERFCKASYAEIQVGEALGGDVSGVNVLLSDVICIDGLPPTSGHVEAPGYISGTLVDTGKPLVMFGRMVLDIDLSDGSMRGIWVFDKGFGTHHGVLRVIGTTDGEVGTGTYTGWIHENR